MRRLFFFLLAAFLLTGSALAADISEEQSESFMVEDAEDGLPDEAREILGDMSVTDGLDVDSGIRKLWNSLKEQFHTILQDALKTTVVIAAAALICSLSAALFENGAVPDFIPLGGTLVISAAAVSDMSSFLSLGTQTLQTLSTYSKVLLPSLATAATASGAVTSATAKYAATALFMDIVLTAAETVIMPAVCAYTAVVIANAAIGGSGLAAAAKLLKSLCRALMIGLVLAFTAYLGVTGILSGATDAVALRVAKTTISSVLPVVGGIISDAAGSVLAGASILRNAIGVFGMLAVLAICLTPFLRLGVRYLLYKLAALISSALSDNRLSGLINGLGDAFGMVTALVGTGGFILFISMISGIRAVSGV